MAAENKQLRAARERTASLASPDGCLSRQELAELVNAWAWEHHHKMVELSANYVGQLERGKIRWPGEVCREALRAILGVSTDAALGFVNDRRAVVRLEDMNRKQFLHTTLGASWLRLDVWKSNSALHQYYLDRDSASSVLMITRQIHPGHAFNGPSQ